MAVEQHARKFYPYIVFVLLTLAVLLPLLTPGFILTLDMVFTPHIRLPMQVTSSYLFYAVLHVMNIIIPADVLQKVVLACIVFLSSIGGYKLVMHTAGQSSAARLGAYVGGALYAINPYTYSRFMAGQFAVLLGYCLLPFLAVQLLVLSADPTWRRSLTVGLLLAGIGIVSIHTLGLAAVLLLVTASAAVWQYRARPQHSKRLAGCLMLATGVCIALSSYWLIPTLTGANATSSAIAGFTSGDEQAFATLGNGLIGKLLHILRLQGFWAENSHTFALPQTVMPGWWIGICLLWVLVGFGVGAAWKSKQYRVAIMFTAIGVIGAMLATGALNPIFDSVVPLFRGFREPHKFTGLVALTYSLFAGWGVKAALEYLSSRQHTVVAQTVAAVVLLLPVAVTPTMFWGFGAQLRPVQYPETWAVVNHRLDSDTASYQVLFLPWHLYMYYRFADRIIMSPAPSYFDKPIISSNDPEIGTAAPDKPDIRKTILSSKILPAAASSSSLGSQLAGLHIKYVIIDKDNDFRSYDYLDRQTDLHLISENTNLKLYLNTAFRG